MKKIFYYVLLVTGVIVALVGIQNLYTFWGDASIEGITGQFTGGVCILGGLVNLWVARNIKIQVNLQKKE